jgi:uncharacterized protein YcbK (DUF882 family)
MREELISFLYSLGLSHFSPQEFLINTERPGNALPPTDTWGNIALTAAVLDHVRGYFQKATVITSCYRSPDYNSRVGGQPRSQHLAFTAVDFSVAETSSREVARYCRSLRGKTFGVSSTLPRVHIGEVPFKEIEDNRMTGGVGSYSRFVHIDTRGINASWRGK